MSVPRFVGITIIDLEKSKRMWFFRTKMAISWNLQQLGWNFALLSSTTQGMCMRNIIGISVIMRALEPAQRFKHTFCLWRQWRLWTYQTPYRSHTSCGTKLGAIQGTKTSSSSQHQPKYFCAKCQYNIIIPYTTLAAMPWQEILVILLGLMITHSVHISACCLLLTLSYLVENIILDSE